MDLSSKGPENEHLPRIRSWYRTEEDEDLGPVCLPKPHRPQDTEETLR